MNNVKKAVKKILLRWYEFCAKIHVTHREKLSEEQAVLNIQNSGYIPVEYMFNAGGGY